MVRVQRGEPPLAEMIPLRRGHGLQKTPLQPWAEHERESKNMRRGEDRGSRPGAGKEAGTRNGAIR
jgi:hypothetical protein